MDVASTLKEMTPLFLLPLGENLHNTQAMNKLNTFFTYHPSSALIVYAAFASEHLPEYLEVTTTTMKARAPCPSLLDLLSYITATNAFGRWVRENGGNGRARDFLGEFVAWFGEQLPRQRDQSSFTKRAGLVLHSVLIQLPPSFSDGTWLGLFATTEYVLPAARFLDLVKPSLAPVRSNPSLRDDPIRALVAVVDGFLFGGQSLIELRSATLRITSRMSWLQCEGSQQPGRSKCVEVKEMMACGKCKAVRYCSKAHQKADWKVHKQVCFEIKWAKDELDG